MTTVTISPKFQIVLPEAIRKLMNLKPGEKLIVLNYDNRIEYIPQKSIKDFKGSLKGISTKIDKEADRL